MVSNETDISTLEFWKNIHDFQNELSDLLNEMCIDYRHAWNIQAEEYMKVITNGINNAG
jgi:hypothetical protein